MPREADGTGKERWHGGVGVPDLRSGDNDEVSFGVCMPSSV